MIYFVTYSNSTIYVSILFIKSLTPSYRLDSSDSEVWSGTISLWVS